MNVLNTAVKETMLIEVRKEQITATNWKRNLAVKGLAPSDHRTDTDIFTALVFTHFGCVPVIIKTRHLGKPGHAQPLVSLVSPD